MSRAEQLFELIRSRVSSAAPEEVHVRSSTRLSLADVIALYESVGHRDSEYLSWLHKVYSSMILPCVGARFEKVLAEDTTKMQIFNIMLDDLADNFVTRSRFLLQDFMRIPWHNAVEKNDYIAVGQAVWDDYITSVRQYPRYKEIEGIFFFDLRQVFSSMEYSSLTNTLGLDNPFETDHHSSYGCAVNLAFDMNLMCTPDFDFSELGTMRAISYLSQKVVHIANVLGTYQREALERDLSSPMISLAIRKGIISKDELGDRASLEKLRQLEWIFRDRALSHVEKVANYEKQICSVNITGFSKSLSDLLVKWGTSPEASHASNDGKSLRMAPSR